MAVDCSETYQKKNEGGIGSLASKLSTVFIKLLLVLLRKLNQKKSNNRCLLIDDSAEGLRTPCEKDCFY